jgi:ABC-type amino acid transport system permease subunit
LRNHWRYFDAALALAVIIGSLFYVYDLLVGSRGLDVAYIARNYTLYVHAVFTNVYATTIAFLVGMAIGFSVGWLRTARSVSLAKFAASMRVEKRERREDPGQSEAARRAMVVLSLLWYGTKYVVRRVGDGFVEVIRGTPLYVQMLFASSFFIVFLPQYATEGLLIGVVALAINTGGYQAEIFRAGLQTVHSGQIEAARAIGFSRLRAMRYVVLPQALRLIIPPLTNEYIGLFKALHRAAPRLCGGCFRNFRDRNRNLPCDHGHALVRGPSARAAVSNPRPRHRTGQAAPRRSDPTRHRLSGLLR